MKQLNFVIASQGNPAFAGFAAREAIQSFVIIKKDWIASSPRASKTRGVAPRNDET